MVYGITSKSQIIDKAAIASGCQRLKTAAVDFSRSGKIINDVGHECTEDVISVDGNSFEEAIVAEGKAISEVEKTICEFADQIIKLSNQIYETQLNEYKAYKKKLEEQNKKGGN